MFATALPTLRSANLLRFTDAFWPPLIMTVKPFFFTFLPLNARQQCPCILFSGISSARSIMSNGTTLPSARSISVMDSTTTTGTVLFANTPNPSTNITLAVMQWSQFINHDMEFTGSWTYSRRISFRSARFSFVPNVSTPNFVVVR